MSFSQADLAEQDTQLFQQFFALEDSIEELKTQMQSEDFYDYYDLDDDLSSITSSACSIASVHEVVKPATADGDEEDDVFEAWTPKVGHVIQYKINLYTRLQKKAAFVLFWRHCGRASPAFLTQVCARMWHALDAKRFEPEKIKFMLNPGKKYFYAKKEFRFCVRLLYNRCFHAPDKSYILFSRAFLIYISHPKLAPCCGILSKDVRCKCDASQKADPLPRKTPPRAQEAKKVFE